MSLIRLFSLQASLSKPTKGSSPDLRGTHSLVGPSRGPSGMTPRQRFQAGSKKLLTSVNASMQVLTSPRQKTKDLSITKDGSGESTSSFGNLRIEDGEEVRATDGIIHGLRDEGDISREAAVMRRWIEQLIDAG